MLWITSPGLSTSVCGIIGSLSGSVYSWMSRSFCTMRPGSERNVQWAPTDALELQEGVVVVGRDGGDSGVGDGDLGMERGELEMLLVLLRAVVTAREREDQRIVALQLAEPSWTPM
jgi:hypothetical protein